MAKLNDEAVKEAGSELDALNRRGVIEYVIICPDCKLAFNSGAAFKYHYRLQHLKTLPKTDKYEAPGNE